jgi:hypothetical protein
MLRSLGGCLMIRFHTIDKKVVGVFVRFRAPLQLGQFPILGIAIAVLRTEFICFAPLKDKFRPP